MNLRRISHHQRSPEGCSLASPISVHGPNHDFQRGRHDSSFLHIKSIRLKAMKQAVGLHWEIEGQEPRASALGWYETGRRPESHGVSPQVRIGLQNRGYMK